MAGSAISRMIPLPRNYIFGNGSYGTTNNEGIIEQVRSRRVESGRMLLTAIDETHKNTYDFLYLPIDFKNKCNVGYAFINMVSPHCLLLI
uniref:Mei2-like C-terminal RNA recognition motif domain-containing protein n=1 Tax=Solanum lycopersicum TaxID=4081 RepID=A0A3Q7HGS4_SOLLC